MDEKLLQSLIYAIAPRIIDNSLSHVGSHRTVVVKIPVRIDELKLKDSICASLALDPLYHPISDDESKSSIEKIATIVQSQIDIIGSSVCFGFTHDKKSAWDPNWPQKVIVIIKKDSSGMQHLVVHSFFISPQIVERGVLTGNCTTILSAVNEYFIREGLDMAYMMKSAVVFRDRLSGIDRNLTPSQTAILLALFFVVLIGLVFILSHGGGFY